MKVLVLVAVTLAGCRVNFEVHDDAAMIDAPDGPVGLGELPAAPRNFCKVDRYAVPVPADADLVIAGTDEGFTAIWSDTQVSAPAQALRVTADHVRIAAPTIPFLTDTRLGGLMDVGDALMMTSATGTTQAISALTQDLMTRPTHIVGVGPLLVRDPFAYEATAGTVGVVVGQEHALDTRYALPSGEVREPASNPISPEVFDISCALGPATTPLRVGHGHCAWTQAGNTVPISCRIADINFDPLAPKMGTNGEFATDCYDLRAASGEPGKDSIIAVWRTAMGQILANYVLNTPVTAPIADRGTAPKVAFDDTRFWIAWLDDAGELAVRSFDQTNGTGTYYPMPGWRPRGPESFELVHRGTETLLAVLRAGELDLLTLCP